MDNLVNMVVMLDIGKYFRWLGTHTQWFYFLDINESCAWLLTNYIEDFKVFNLKGC